jgi:hypothetical protein
VNNLCKGQFTRQSFFSDDHDMLGKEYIEDRDLADFFIFFIFFVWGKIMGLKD